MRILFSSAGRRVGLMKCFQQAAKELGISLDIYAIDLEPEWCPACHYADKSWRVPRCTDADFISRVEEICKQQSIDLIIPTIDPELEVYSDFRQELAKEGTEVLLPPAELVKIAADKFKTATVLAQHGIATPRSRRSNDLQDTSTVKLPVFAKPLSGSRSVGAQIIRSQVLLATIKEEGDYIIQEECSGEEYTANCYFDHKSGFVCTVPHYRKKVRSGEVCYAETRSIPEFQKVAEKLRQIVPDLDGVLSIQGFKKSDEELKIFEINARFSGGYPLCDYAGGTYAKWILQRLAGQQPDYHIPWQAGVRMIRYDEAYYLKSE
ncbi:MAG: ATP-grasp domain-containing protein [Lentisphaeria bacterium]